MKVYIFIFFSLFFSFLLNAQTGCNVSSLDIRTGFNYSTNSPYSAPPYTSTFNEESLVADSYWKIISDNNPQTIEPRPAFVIGQNPFWVSYSNGYCYAPINPLTNYIRDYPTKQSLYVSNSISVYEYEFCVNDKTGINLNIGVRAQGDAEVFINGFSLGKLSTYSGFIPNTPCGGSNTYVYFLYYRQFQTNNSSYFNVGNNKITIVTNNNQPYGYCSSCGFQIDAGLNVNGQITGVSGAFTKPNCCKNYIALSGMKYIDGNYNGIKDNYEAGQVGKQINLKNSSGTIIASAITDVNGYYFFSNSVTTPASNNNTSLLVPGSYQLEELNPSSSGFFQVYPPNNGSRAFTVSSNQLVTGLDFGNAPCYSNTSINLFNYVLDDPTLFALNGLPSNVLNNYNFVWDFGDGSVGYGPNPTHVYSLPGGNKIVTVTGTPISGSCIINATKTINQVSSITNYCPHCIPSFKPFPNRKYVLSAWVSEETISAQEETFVDPEIFLEFNTSSGSIITLGPYKAKGNIIDEWQRVDEVFTVPGSAVTMNIKLCSRLGSSEPVYFDDVRIHPFDAGFKSYVYDPLTLKFTAELDNNNYATLYEYDEEGKLVRVKKETERKKVTIKESRNSSVKKP